MELQADGISQPGINSEDFFAKLVKGDFGLPMTFWLFGLIVPLVAAMIIGAFFGLVAPNFVCTPGFSVFFYVLGFFYSVPLTIGIWNAASRYMGFFLWRLLAQISVALTVVSWIFEIFGLFILVGSA